MLSTPGPGAPPQGAPRPFKVDPAKLPTAKDLNKELFPASFAVTVDRNGLRLAVREPLPGISAPLSNPALVAPLLLGFENGRTTARRVQCENNLKMIGLALQSYADDHKGGFPKAAISKARLA